MPSVKASGTTSMKVIGMQFLRMKGMFAANRAVRLFPSRNGCRQGRCTSRKKDCS